VESVAEAEVGSIAVCSRAAFPMQFPDRHVPLRHAIAAALSALILFVGVVHEVVGSTLYPAGPAYFGGSLYWHLAGVALTVAGALLVGSTLGLFPFPVRVAAAVICVAGAFIAADDFVTKRQFHLFAFTLCLAGAGVVVSFRPGRRSPENAT
jgi:hypothetical protein